MASVGAFGRCPGQRVQRAGQQEGEGPAQVRVQEVQLRHSARSAGLVIGFVKGVKIRLLNFNIGFVYFVKVRVLHSTVCCEVRFRVRQAAQWRLRDWLYYQALRGVPDGQVPAVPRHRRHLPAPHRQQRGRWQVPLHRHGGHLLPRAAPGNGEEVWHAGKMWPTPTTWPPSPSTLTAWGTCRTEAVMVYIYLAFARHT
jgi:hypothetical protein